MLVEWPSWDPSQGRQVVVFGQLPPTPARSNPASISGGRTVSERNNLGGRITDFYTVACQPGIGIYTKQHLSWARAGERRGYVGQVACPGYAFRSCDGPSGGPGWVLMTLEPAEKEVIILRIDITDVHPICRARKMRAGGVGS